MGNFVRESATPPTTLSVPSYVERVFCACVGGGGGGGSTPNTDSTSAASGGGGGGYIQASVNITDTRGGVRYFVGGGGARATGGSSTVGGTGAQSYVGPSSARITAFGGTGGESSPGASGGGTSQVGGAAVNNVSSGNGESTPDVRSDTNARAGRGGGAGRPGGGNCGGYDPGNPPGQSGIPGCSEHGGSGGNGVNVSNGNNRNNGPQAVCGQLSGKAGGSCGGGGGGGSRRNNGGNGADGGVYISWITFKRGNTNINNGGPNDPYILYSGESFNLNWNSPYTDGNQNVSYTNNTTQATTERIQKTDSRNARSEIFFSVQPGLRINSFSANPNPQNSGLDGIPNYNTTLSWNLQYGAPGPKNYTIQGGGNTFTGTTTNNGSLSVNNLRQSIVENGLSPRGTPYTLTVTDGFSTATATITVNARNDNNPVAFTVPSPTGVNPSSVVTIFVGLISGIDMATTVNGSSGLTFSTNNSTYSSSILINNNQNLYIRVTSPPFNTNFTGLTNQSQVYTVNVGQKSSTFTVTTRAPDVNETFNVSDYSDYVPNPDIDTIPDVDPLPENQSNAFIETDAFQVDDIEIQVPIRTNNPNVQVRIRKNGTSTFGPWQDITQIGT